MKKLYWGALVALSLLSIASSSCAHRRPARAAGCSGGSCPIPQVSPGYESPSVPSPSPGWGSDGLQEGSSSRSIPMLEGSGTR